MPTHLLKPTEKENRMPSFQSFFGSHKIEYFQCDTVTETHTGHRWTIQKTSIILGQTHFLVERIQKGYAPACVLLSETGMRRRFRLFAQK